MHDFNRFLQLQRLHCDVEQLQSHTSRQRDQLESKARQLFELTEKDRRNNILIEEERGKLKNTREEVQN